MAAAFGRSMRVAVGLLTSAYACGSSPESVPLQRQAFPGFEMELPDWREVERRVDPAAGHVELVHPEQRVSVVSYWAAPSSQDVELLRLAMRKLMDRARVTIVEEREDTVAGVTAVSSVARKDGDSLLVTAWNCGGERDVTLMTVGDWPASELEALHARMLDGVRCGSAPVSPLFPTFDRELPCAPIQEGTLLKCRGGPDEGWGFTAAQSGPETHQGLTRSDELVTEALKRSGVERIVLESKFVRDGRTFRVYRVHIADTDMVHVHASWYCPGTDASFSGSWTATPQRDRQRGVAILAAAQCPSPDAPLR